jgi:hypothetical protein
MAAIAPITINDGQATPVAVTFNPENQTPGAFTFVDRTSGVAIGFRRISISNKFAQGGALVNRAKFAVEYPVTSTVNGITSQAYVLRANVDVILPVASTDAERKNLFAFLSNGLANTLVRGAVRDLDPLY